MKSRILSFSIMKENFKKQLWAPALLTLGFFLILPVAGMVCLEILQSRGWNRRKSSRITQVF